MAAYNLNPNYEHLKHCFIEIPQLLSPFPKFSNIAQIEWINGSAYMWVLFKPIPDNICKLDKTYSSCLGLHLQDNILVRFIYSDFIECISLVLVPVRNGDWDTLAPENKQFSLTFLEQQRIVWKNLILPFWVHTNVCTFFKVVSFTPIADFVILRKNTEVTFRPNLDDVNTNKPSKVNNVRNYSTFTLSDSIDDDFAPSILFSQLLDIFNNYFGKSHLIPSTIGYSKVRITNNEISTMYETLILSNQLKYIKIYSSQFITDGFDLFLKSKDCFSPKGAFYDKIYHKRQTCAIIAYFSMSSESKFICETCPIRVFTYTKPSIDCYNNSVSALSVIQLRQSISTELSIKSVTVLVLQQDFETYGREGIIKAFKFKLLDLTKEFPFPIKKQQRIILDIDGTIFTAKLDVEVLRSREMTDSSYYLIDPTILSTISVKVSPALCLKENSVDFSKYYTSLNILPNEDLFFGYNSLKMRSKCIIESFFSQINQFKKSLTLLITSHSSDPRVGRKAFVDYLVFLVSQFVQDITVNSLDGLILKGKSSESIKSSIEKLFHCDGIAIIYNIDHLLPDNNSELNISKLGFNLFRLISSFITKRNHNTGKLIFICTSRGRERIQPYLGKEARHFLNYQFVLPPPTYQDKVEILQGTFKNHKLSFENKRYSNKLISKYPNISAGKFFFVVKEIIQGFMLQNMDFLNILVSQDMINNEFANFIQRSSENSLRPSFKYDHSTSDFTFAKIDEIIKLQLNYPLLLKDLPLFIKSGILIYGMPGTGKTYLVESIASLYKLNILKIRGPELLNKYVGSSEDNIRQVFLTARICAPCILFFDEFDSFATSRGFESTGVLDRVVNQLLTEIDGVNELEGVCIIATTCHPELIDPALLRPGRIGCHLKCSLPDYSKRVNILNSLVYKLNIGITCKDLERIAHLTDKFSCADLIALLMTCTNNMIVNTNVTQVNAFSLQNLMSGVKSTCPSINDEERLLYDFHYENFKNPKVSPNLAEINNIFA